MALELHNSWEYDGDKQNWWHWSAYIVGDDISNVASVEYILHPTFKKPLRSVRATLREARVARLVTPTH